MMRMIIIITIMAQKMKDIPVSYTQHIKDKPSLSRAESPRKKDLSKTPRVVINNQESSRPIRAYIGEKSAIVTHDWLNLQATNFLKSLGNFPSLPPFIIILAIIEPCQGCQACTMHIIGYYVAPITAIRGINQSINQTSERAGQGKVATSNSIDSPGKELNRSYYYNWLYLTNTLPCLVRSFVHSLTQE